MKTHTHTHTQTSTKSFSWKYFKTAAQISTALKSLTVACVSMHLLCSSIHQHNFKRTRHLQCKRALKACRYNLK